MLLTLKHTNKLNGIVKNTITHDKKIRIFPHVEASLDSLSSAGKIIWNIWNILLRCFHLCRWKNIKAHEIFMMKSREEKYTKWKQFFLFFSGIFEQKKIWREIYFQFFFWWKKEKRFRERRKKCKHETCWWWF